MFILNGMNSIKEINIFMIMFKFVSLPIIMVVTEWRGTRDSAVGWRSQVRFPIV